MNQKQLEHLNQSTNVNNFLQPESEKQPSQQAVEVQSLDRNIDDILTDFLLTRAETQVIGTPQQKPELRQMSSEEFISNFHQEGGQ